MMKISGVPIPTNGAAKTTMATRYLRKPN